MPFNDILLKGTLNKKCPYGAQTSLIAFTTSTTLF